MIRLLLVDDLPMVRRGIRMRLALEPDLTVVGEADNGPDAAALARKFHPDVVLMDVEMPGVGGVDSIDLIRRASPRSAVVMLSLRDDSRARDGALAAGAAAFVAKYEGCEALVAAIRRVARHPAARGTVSAN